MVTELFKSKNECCGCTACYSICPYNAIEMKVDEEGFSYPRIKETKCKQCGLCKKVCDFKQFEKLSHDVKTLAVRCKDQKEILQSRSGGIFAMLAKSIIESGGVVFGCSASNVTHICHKSANNMVDVQEFRKSKYVQSDMGKCFEECCRYLLEDRYVLFSGTGCQVHGLISYLTLRNVSMNKLLTIDIVCHGVPSPGIWKEWISFLQNKRKKKIKEVEFRNKALFGWAAHMESYTFDDNTMLTTDIWTELFASNAILRPSCYQCPYTTPYRNSDITIADYWGIEKNVPELNDDKGVSLVIIQSNKGNDFFYRIKDYIEFYETSLDNSLQPNLIKPSEAYAKRKRVMEYYSVHGSEKFINKYLNNHSLFYLAIKFKKKAGRLFRKQ